MEKSAHDARKIIFFDGVCHLCNGFVDHVLLRDMSHKYSFAPLQGQTAELLLQSEFRTDLDSVVFYDSGTLYFRSTAVLKILSGLGGTYQLLKIAWIIPRPIRDLGYNLVAKLRYKLFGKRDFCRIPTPEDRQFLLP